MVVVAHQVRRLSRGKAESGLLFEITLLLQDVGRIAADLLIFYMQEFGYVALAADVTTGSTGEKSYSSPQSPTSSKW